MTRLHAEVARSVNFYKGQQGGSPPVRLLLSGGSSIIPYTDRFFQEKVQIPVQYFNPFRNVEVDSSLSREDLARCAHFFGEVVGLGLRRATECPLEVNLLPHSIRARKQFEQKRPYLAGAAGALLLIPLCFLGYVRKTAELKQRQFNDVTAEVTRLNNLDRTLRTEQAQLTEVKSKADQVTTIINQRSLWPQLLDDLNQRIAPGLWITSLGPETGASTGTQPAGPAHGGGRRRGPSRSEEEEGAAPAPAVTTRGGTPGQTTVAELRIEGGGPHTSEDLKLVDDFANKLRESPFFDKASVTIEKPPSVAPKDVTFTFILRAKLAKPITY